VCFNHILNGYFVHKHSSLTVMSCHVLSRHLMFVLCYVAASLDINVSYLIRKSLFYVTLMS
jgi:hypothetical protein